MDPIKHTPVSMLAAETDPKHGLETTILEVPCLVEFWAADGSQRVTLWTLEGDHTVTLAADPALSLGDVINNALIAHGDPMEWPGFAA